MEYLCFLAKRIYFVFVYFQFHYSGRSTWVILKFTAHTVYRCRDRV